MSANTPLRQAGAALFGPVVWAGHFLVSYASEVLACHQAAPRLHDLVVAIATLAAILAIVWHRLGASRRLRRAEADDAQHFLLRLGAALDGLSLIGIGWAALAAMLVSACR
jgi:hypothetical protein